MRPQQTTSTLYAKTNYQQYIVFLLLLPALLLLAIPLNADTVNINRADAAALQQNLEGIGPVKADAIIKYRKKHGAFKSTADLSKVPGIGPEILKKNRKNLSTSRGLVKGDKSKMKNQSSKSKSAATKKESSARSSMKKKTTNSGKKLKQEKKSLTDKAAKKSKKANTKKAKSVSKTSKSKKTKNNSKKKSSNKVKKEKKGKS